MINIGLCGAHRTGKTTLAIALSKELETPFIQIGTSKIFSDHNLDAAKSMDFRTRIYIQRIILDHAEKIWSGSGESFICDRTPIDMMAYTLAEVQGKTLGKELEWELQEYLRDCREATEKCFSYLFVVPPAIPIIDEVGKASPSRGYIEHIHRICVGLWSGMLTGCQIPKDTVDLNERVKYVTEYLWIVGEQQLE